VSRLSHGTNLVFQSVNAMLRGVPRWPHCRTAALTAPRFSRNEVRAEAELGQVVSESARLDHKKSHRWVSESESTFRGSPLGRRLSSCAAGCVVASFVLPQWPSTNEPVSGKRANLGSHKPSGQRLTLTQPFGRKVVCGISERSPSFATALGAPAGRHCGKSDVRHPRLSRHSVLQSRRQSRRAKFL